MSIIQTLVSIWAIVNSTNVTVPTPLQCPICLNQEYQGILLGVIAIAIALFAFIWQIKDNKKLKALIETVTTYNQAHQKVEDAIKKDSMLGIQAFMTEATRQLEMLIRELNKQPSTTKLMDLLFVVGFHDTLLVNSNAIIRNANNLKFLAYSFYQEAEIIGRRLEYLSQIEEFRSRIPDSYQSWEKLAQDAIKEMNDLSTKIKDELKASETQS